MSNSYVSEAAMCVTEESTIYGLMRSAGSAEANLRTEDGPCKRIWLNPGQLHPEVLIPDVLIPETLIPEVMIPEL